MGAHDRRDDRKEAVSILHLPDELLLRIIAWVPYWPRSHSQLPLVCRRLHKVMDTKSLPGMISWYQFSPFMRLLEGYRGRPTSDFSRDELWQTWRSIAMHRDWIAFLKATTGLSLDFCLTSCSIFHFIAAAHSKCLGNFEIERAFWPLEHWRTYVFLAKMAQNLPPDSLLLLRYIARITLQDVHDRHAPFDILQHLNGWPANNPSYFDSTAKTFFLNCVLENSCLLLDTYRPFYNIMADEHFYQSHIRRQCENVTKAINLVMNLPTLPDQYQYNRELPLSGMASLHIRLIEIAKEGRILSPVDLELGPGADISTRLSFEHKRMETINYQIERKFANLDWSVHMVRGLDLEGIGRLLKATVSALDKVKSNKLQSLQDVDFQMYDLDEWP